jgi:hypothetical protein
VFTTNKKASLGELWDYGNALRLVNAANNTSLLIYLLLTEVDAQKRGGDYR